MTKTSTPPTLATLVATCRTAALAQARARDLAQSANDRVAQLTAALADPTAAKLLGYDGVTGFDRLEVDRGEARRAAFQADTDYDAAKVTMAAAEAALPAAAVERVRRANEASGTVEPAWATLERTLPVAA